MFMNDVNKKEEIRNIAVKHLRKYGIKHRNKAIRSAGQVIKSKKLFHVPLQNLENETVTLRNGQQLVIPKRLNEMCSYILSKADTEGIFRKEGSKSRQNEIKLSLDRGCMLGNDHHVIDVAVVMKCFLRELPEPLIPYSFHELFVRCSLVEKKIEAISLACLLLPTEHLNVLSYLMQFLHEISNHAKYNKMNSYNLSVLLGPNIFPINEKLAPKNNVMVKKTCDITKHMIDNSKNIGLIPDYIIEQIGNLNSGELEAADKVKRRRSGSLTRIFNGLRKMVSNRTDEDNITAVATVTPDLLLTPSVSYSKKRFHSKVDKNKSKDDSTVSKKSALERRWSAITSATSNLRRKKRESFVFRPSIDNNSLNCSKPEYMRISKSEYEDIKNRVSAIEKRLSFELENAQSTVISKEVNIVHDIQSAYEQTLVQTEPLSSGTDQFVRRLSRELRIRTPDEKLIRSPSARKIGNIRRRSRELEKPGRLVQTSSLRHISPRMNSKPVSRSASASSSIKTSISLKTNITDIPYSFNTDTVISFNTPGSSFDLSSNVEYSNSPSHKNTHFQNAGQFTPDRHSPRNRSSQDRRGIKRSANVSPIKRGLKQRYCNFDGHHLVESTAVTPDCNKENGMEDMDILSTKTIPRIKRPIQVSRTPKRLCTPKGSRINTPLRVLPPTRFNIPDF